LPPVAVRHYIRHLSVNIERLRPNSFSALSRLSTAIPALQQLDIKIQECPDHISRTPVVLLPLHDALSRIPLATFDTKKLDVTYYPTEVFIPGLLPWVVAFQRDDLEQPLLDKL
jgi:hypothetical protein